MTDTAPKARPGLITLYARRFGRMGDSIAEGFRPLVWFVERQVKGLACDHEFKYVKRRTCRICEHCGAKRRA